MAGDVDDDPVRFGQRKVAAEGRPLEIERDARAGAGRLRPHVGHDAFASDLARRRGHLHPLEVEERLRRAALRLVADGVLRGSVEQDDHARRLAAGPLFDLQDVRRGGLGHDRGGTRAGIGGRGRHEALSGEAFVDGFEHPRRRPKRGERPEVFLDAAHARPGPAVALTREDARRAIELREGGGRVPRHLAGELGLAYGRFAGPRRRAVGGRGAIEIERLLPVLLAPVDAEEALGQGGGEGVELRRARPRGLLSGARLDRLGQRDDLRPVGEDGAGSGERSRAGDLKGEGVGRGVGTGFASAAGEEEGERGDPRAAPEGGGIFEVDLSTLVREEEESHVSESQSHSSPSPIYADRATGQTFPDARAMVNAYLARFGSRAGSSLEPLDDQGYTQVTKGSASVGVNVLEDHGVLLMLAPVMAVPVTGRETFYRRLLELSFLTTADAAFAIDSQKDEVYVRVLRRLSGLDYEEFEDLLDTVGKVADEWDDLLKKEFGDGKA